MTSLLFSFSLPFFFFKSFTLLGLGFSWDMNVLFLLSIFPPVFYIVSSSLFNFCNLMELFFYRFVFLSIFSVLGLCFISDNSFFFLFFLESCVVSMLWLILNFSKDYDKLSSSFFMFFMNILGSIPFMYFSFFCPDLPLSLFYESVSLDSFFIFFCFFLLVVSKLPILFFHFWLTKAHVSASGSGSMILASLMLKIGSLGLLKFSYFFICFFSFNLVSWALGFSLFSSLFFLFLMVRFFDVKYMVACSSIVHMALIFPFITLFSDLSVFSSVLMMSSHGIVSCFIFFLVTILYESSFNRSIDLNKSLESSNKILLLFLFFFFLFNLGFPPLVSFLCEVFYISVLVDFSVFSSALFLVSLILGGKVFISVILSMFFGKKNFSFPTPSDPIISFLSLFYFFFFLALPFFLF